MLSSAGTPTAPARFAALRRYLDALGPGPIEDADALLEFLEPVWPSLAGADAGKMETWKLDRIEEAEWWPPLLSFVIERHGSLALGATRAELTEWVVDLELRSASVAKGRHRQLRAMAPRLKVEPIAAELVRLIVDGHDDRRLSWSIDRTRVRVLISEIVPSNGYRQTVAGRRKRLAVSLGPSLAEAGWSPGLAAWRYIRDAGGSQ